MDAFASPSTRGDSSFGGTSRLVEAAVTALVLALSLMSIPAPPNPGLDASWQEMLIRAHAQGLQFGRDIIFTWGPWGFLCARYHLGAVGAVPILVWQTAGQFLIALALVALTHSLPRWRRIVFAASFLAFHWLFLDGVYFVLIALIAIAGLMGRGAPFLRLLIWAAVLGFLSQLKFTYLVISAAAVFSSAACWSGRRMWGRALAIPGAYLASLLVSWVAAGQSADNLYPYLRRSLEIASGYKDAMGLDESWLLFAWGLGLMLVCAAFVVQVWRTVPDRPFALGVCAILSFTFFVMWNESYTRADIVPLGGHIFGIFTFVLMLAPALPGLIFPGRRIHWFDGSFLFCLVAIASFDPEYFAGGPKVAWDIVYWNARALGRLGSFPSDWQGQYESACAAAALPRVRAAVGQATVDVYDFSLGIAILNGLNVSPRPIFQGYSAYTQSLEGWNLRYYQSAKAPEFLLWKDERVDNRYPGMDEAPVVAGLPGHYEPLFAEGDYWLFKRVSPLSKSAPERIPLFDRTVHLSEEMSLPEDLDKAVWLVADPVPNALGRLRSLAYKPAAINIVTTDDEGRQLSWRLPPRIARAGFLLVPTLESGADLALLMKGGAHSWVRSFHFEAPQDQGEFWSHVDVKAFGLPGLPLPRLADTLLIELGIFDRRAVSVTSVATPRVVDTPDGKALLLHAEGEIVFAVPPGAGRLAFGYGIREGAYTGEGHTDGVAFDVEARWTSGRHEHLWGRYLDPVASAGDRGIQQVEIALPEDGPAQLVMHTGPGPNHDNRWDWSYVSTVRFETPAGDLMK